MFVSTKCDACIELLPSLRSLGRRFRNLNLIVVANDDPEPTRRFAKAQRLTGLQVVASRRLGGIYGVTYPPYAFAIDEWGVVRAKGLVNHAEHVRSLLNAMHENLSPTPDLDRHAVGVQSTTE